MKKIAMIALICWMTAAMVGCKSGDAKDSIIGSQKNDYNVEMDSAQSGEKDESVENHDDEKKKQKVVYANISDCADDMFFGYVKDSTDYVAMNNKGEVLFTLTGGRSFADQNEYFIGEYALMSDKTVIDKTGKTVFDLADTEYDAIYYSKCLDVGYVLCSKAVNTFEETGNHYFAVNVEDGTAFQFASTEEAPKAEEDWYYFGNGYFVWSERTSYSYVSECKIVNVTTNETYAGYLLNADGSKDYENVTALNCIKGLHENWNEPILKKGETTYISTYEFASVSNPNNVYTLDLTTGCMRVTDAIYANKYTYIDYVDDTRLANVSDIDAQMDKFSSEYFTFLYDVSRNSMTMMTDYRNFEIYRQSPEGAYCAMVENEGRGTFLAVIEQDGTRRFEPIPINEFKSCNDHYIVVGTEAGTEVYNWNGEQIAVWDEEITYHLGEESIVYSFEGTLHHFYNFETKDTFIIEELENAWTSGGIRYHNGYYSTNNLLVSEDGEVIYMEVK